MSVEQRRGREQCTHVVAPERAVAQREQTRQRPPKDTLGQRAHGHAVVNDAGGHQVFVHESRVWILGAVQHRHAFERHARAHRIHDSPHDRPHLVVGIGAVDDVGAEWPNADHLDGSFFKLGADAFEAREHHRVRVRRSGETGDDRRRLLRGDRPQQPGSRCAPPLRQEAHDGAEIAQHRRTLVDNVGGDAHQVALVVPVARERLPSGAMYPHNLAGALMLRGEQIELLIVEVGQLAVHTDQRFLGRGMGGDGFEHAGLLRQHASHRGRDDGHRYRPPAGRRARRRTEQFGEAVHREKGDTDDAAAVRGQRTEFTGGKEPARRDTDGVRRHDDGDGRERLVALGPGHRIVQALRRGTPVRSRDDGDGHPADRRTRVRHLPGTPGGHTDQTDPRVSGSRCVQGPRELVDDPGPGFTGGSAGMHHAMKLVDCSVRVDDDEAPSVPRADSKCRSSEGPYVAQSYGP